MFDWLEDLFVQQWLQTLGWAAGVALAVQVAGVLGGGPATKSAASAVGLALGFMAGLFTVLDQLPALPPDERWQWCGWLTVAALLLLMFEERHGSAAMVRFVVHLGLVVALLWWVVRPSSRAADWSPLTAQIAYLGSGLALLVVLLVGEARTATQPAWRSLLPCVVTGAATVAIFAGGVSDKLARCTAGLTAALLTSLLLALAHRSAPPARTTQSVAALCFASLLGYAWAASSLSDTAALLLIASWASQLLPYRPAATGYTIATVGVLPAVASLLAWWLRSPAAAT
jgi:hypothetical protein